MNYVTHLPSPLGTLTLLCDGEALTGLGLPQWRHPPGDLANAVERDDLPVFGETRRWLEAYFARMPLPTTPPIHAEGSPFQELVWAELAAVPYGTLTTYGALSASLEKKTGRRQSARAVGGAVGRNPVSILIPCHRVVGSGGSLTGYGGGLDAKLALLTLEGVDLTALTRPIHGTAL